MELIVLFFIIEISVYISILICFKLNLFIGKFRFIVASILTTWIFEVLIMQLFDISGFIFIFIFFPCLCLLILYLLGKLSHISFSFHEYGLIFILYIPYEIIILIVAFLIYDILGIPFFI